MENIKRNVHWLLRGVFAAVFLYHGLTKFPVAAGMASMMNMPIVAVYLLALMETIGGVLILVGGFKKDWATRLSGVFIFPIMLGAIMMMHRGQWSFIPSEQFPTGGMEFQVVLLVLSLYFIVKGNEIE
jgi:putative oxidoreductase